MLSGQQKLASLFYITNMHNYEEIETIDMVRRCRAPPDVRRFLQTNESFCLYGDTTKGGGGDFILQKVVMMDIH